MAQHMKPNSKWSEDKHPLKIWIKWFSIMAVIKAMALMRKTATRAEEASLMNKLNSRMREAKH